MLRSLAPRKNKNSGANPRSWANFGKPPMLKALPVFAEVMRADARLSEIGNSPVRVESFVR